MNWFASVALQYFWSIPVGSLRAALPLSRHDRRQQQFIPHIPVLYLTCELLWIIHHCHHNLRQFAHTSRKCWWSSPLRHLHEFFYFEFFQGKYTGVLVHKAMLRSNDKSVIEKVNSQNHQDEASWKGCLLNFSWSFSHCNCCIAVLK